MAPGVPILPLSALNKFNTDRLLREIIARLPEGPPYFPKDQLTDRYERFFVSESSGERSLKLTRKRSPILLKLKSRATRRRRH